MAPTDEHPINVVVRRTGLSPHLIRQWEHRYGMVTPARGAGNQRLYTDADVDRLRLLALAMKTGHPIGQVAHLPGETLLRYISENSSVHQPHLPAIVDAAGSAEEAKEACM